MNTSFSLLPVLLIRSLLTHNSLEKLNLYETAIGFEEYQALRELISSSTSLKTLYVGINDFPSEAVDGLVISGLHHNGLIISGLHHNITIQWLDMYG